MKINKEVTIELTPDDIEKAVVEYLKDKELVSDTCKAEVKFKVNKHREGEDLMSPGYDVLTFEGCTVTVR